ncbi:hypothetical protein EDC04DRAFT_2801075 [Pisolithus marmoratus]|nr:hypothetical protein EDC04DRAFT_2801075 [Pisolithus marmoratus]
MSASFAYEDPYLRQQTQAGITNTQKAREIFKEMGRGMWRTGKGFGKVGALFAGIELPSQNDMVNPVAAGFAVFGGGLAFAAFSGAIDWFSATFDGGEPKQLIVLSAEGLVRVPRNCMYLRAL